MGVIGSAAAGMGTGLSLIVAIGAQNAFVLRQGIRREAVPWVVAICALSDAALIAAGTAGVGAAVERWPSALRAVGLAGGLFLLGYAVLAARRVLRPSALRVPDGGTRTTGPEAATGSGAATAAGTAPGPSARRRAVLTCLAMTWLNPHVYLDTVLLLGSVGSQHGSLRWVFAAGAMAGSVVWFTALGFGGRLLAGVFARPAAWRVLDAVIALTMAWLGTVLLLGQV